MNLYLCCVCVIYAAVDLLAWSPDGTLYVMVTGNHIDICAFKVCESSVRPSTPFSTDTDTPIFCCQLIPMQYRYVAQRD